MRSKAFLLVFCLLLLYCQRSSANPVDIAKLKVDLSQTASERELTNGSDLIIIGTTTGKAQSFPTNERLQTYRVVNYTQKIRVSRMLKGLPRLDVKLLTVGVEPLPDASNPLNNLYSGPLAEGEYILFLKRITGTDLYSLTGVWQGVYPIIEKKTIALKGFGYPSFHQLTINEFQKKIEMMTPKTKPR